MMVKSKKRPIVWFVQEPMMLDFNFANLEDFGEINFLLRHQDRPALNPGNAIRLIRNALMTWSEDDYFCSYGGDPLGVGITFMVMAEIWGPNCPIRWLRYNRGRDEDGVRDMKNGYYEQTRFALDAKPLDDELWEDKIA